MAKKWTIREGEPLKVRVVGMTENDPHEGRVKNRLPRVRIVSRIAKMLVALWVLSIASWLQSCHHGASAGEPQDAIDGQSNPFDVM